MGSELDLRRLTELQQILGAGLPEIVTTLIDELTTATAQIETSIAGGDLPSAALAAHAARNSALMLDANPLLDALREIESGASHDDAPRVHAGLGRLRSSWPALRSQLQAAAQLPT
ncbi:MAG: Hpt domain-containing protein [Actinomycetota bacterium]|nr:Hpt domain-containing protein [Actinomycetota bacterium]